MSKFRNLTTQVVVSVADDKDDRFSDGWEPAGTEKRTRSTSKKTD
jgi:hypothetical protein